MAEASSIDRINIIASARSWIGTPYHHQQSVKGAGTDCLGLVRGVFRELYGWEPAVPPYSRDWGEAIQGEPLQEAGLLYLEPVVLRDAKPGDVLVFRMLRSMPAKHCGILTGGGIIHAWQGYAVAEVPYDRAWFRRLAYAFQFPGAEPWPH